jgi:preprotein translocase subunit SecG
LVAGVFSWALLANPAFSDIAHFLILSVAPRSFPTFQPGKDFPVTLFAFWPWLAGPLNFILILLGLFLILLVLIQRGKGGGLIGALGGAGGSSPFGSRAGDTFTRITIYAACIWLLLTMIQVRAIQSNALVAQKGQFGARP